jgi:general secretion pathway protein K
MKTFSSSRGVALLSALLIILILSLVAANISGLLLSDANNESIVEKSSSHQIIQNTSNKILQDYIQESLASNKNKINKDMFKNIQSYQISFQGYQLDFKINDKSNCFNINALFIERNGNLINNPATAQFFRRLLTSFEVQDFQIDAILDQIYDWVDKDNIPRQNGYENYYYSGPAIDIKRFTSKRLFFHISELKNLPSFKTLNTDIMSSLCVIPWSTDLIININTLLKSDKKLFANFLLKFDEELSETIINKIPDEGFESINTFIAFADIDFDNDSLKFLSTQSHALEVSTLISSNFSTSKFISLMKIKNSKINILDVNKLY